MSLKFEGVILEEIRDLKERLLMIERAVEELKVKPPQVDEVNEWLSRRYKAKDGRI